MILNSTVNHIKSLETLPSKDCDSNQMNYRELSILESNFRLKLSTL